MKILTLLAFMLSSQFLYAQVSTDLMDMSLEDLLDVKVSVASKQELSRSEAPGFITVYTASEIKSLGYYTLAELANITPGFTSLYKFVGKQSYTVRGQRVPGANLDNNKVLVLVDGISMNHLRNGRAPINEELALDGVERVEFLKGPASALYGTGAFFGVINVISKSLVKEGSTIEGRSTFGSFGTRQNSASSFFKNDEVEAKAILSHSEKNSMRLPWGQGGNEHRHSIDHLDALSLNSSLTLKEGALKDLTGGYIHHGNRSGTWDNYGDSTGVTQADTGYYLFKTSTAFLKYKKEISDKLSMNFMGRRGFSSEESRSYKYRQNFSSYEGLVEGNYQINSDSALIFGLNYDQRQRDGSEHGTYQNTASQPQNDYVNDHSNPLRTYSSYVQHSTVFAVGAGLHVTSGLRFDKATAKEGLAEIDVSQLSPRLALVQKLTDAFSLKLLFGRALRSPDLKAIGVANEAVTERNNVVLPSSFETLTAEKISSYEFGITYDKGPLSTTLASFYTVVTDQIGRETVDITPSVPADDPANIYRNKSGDSIGHGLEYEIRYALNSGNIFNFNAAWNMAQLPDNSVDQKNQFGGVPSYTSSASYIRKWNKFTGSLIGTYFGTRRTGLNTQDPQGGFFLLDANLGYDFNSTLNLALWIRNFGNRDYRYSSSGTQDNTAERGAARSIFTNLNLTF